VEAVFRMNGSDGSRPTPLISRWRSPISGAGLDLGYVSDWGEEPPLWWCLRFCPDEPPLVIAIEEEPDLPRKVTPGG
jgi:hypothetical protein